MGEFYGCSMVCGIRPQLHHRTDTFANCIATCSVAYPAMSTSTAKNQVRRDLKEAEEDDKDSCSEGHGVEIDTEINHDIVCQGVGHVATIQLQEEDFCFKKPSKKLKK